MEENLKIDTDYLASFNLGYELAKELNLKSPMFKRVHANPTLQAMQNGMIEYANEIERIFNENILKAGGLGPTI